ncbi:hypothetical protein [Ornithinibacillus halophilus]|uniref:hypothetical protein n=1 Tax=Ornithinibacillus halophilus TaxID=930117 RepID=UPI001F2DB2C1|nr:hypothetical protein [Ornithinibacillus halophilus]
MPVPTAFAFWDSSAKSYADSADATQQLETDHVIDINGKSTDQIASDIANLKTDGEKRK